MRLIKYIQNTFNLSRRKIVDKINSESILLNGTIQDSYSLLCQNGDIIDIIDENILNHKINIQTIAKKLVIFNKPIGYVVSKDDKNNKTIFEILPKELNKFYYIGRLDKNSRGLLLLTNDTELVNKLSHPSFVIQKEYIVVLNKNIQKIDIDKIIDGIYEGGEMLRINSITKIKDRTVNIILTEGKKRHIRRIFCFLGYKILDLQRIKEGQYSLEYVQNNQNKKIKEGDFRILDI